MRVDELLRASHPEPAAAVTVLSVVLAAATGRPAGGVAAVSLAVGAGQLSVGWHNDWLDAARDRAAGRTDKPVAAGRVPRGVVGRAAGAALVAVVPLSLLSGWRAALAHVVAVAVAWAYNARLKATLLSWLPYAVAFPLLVAFVTLGGRGHPAPAVWELATAALLGAGAHLANAAPDVDDDLAAGLRGLPARLGARAAVTGAAGLLVAGTATVAVGSASVAGLAALALAVVLVSVGAVVGRRPGSRAPFRAAMAVALVDTVALVAAVAS